MLEFKAAVGVGETVLHRSPVWQIPGHKIRLTSLEATAVMGAQRLHTSLPPSPGLVDKMTTMEALPVVKVHLETDPAVHDESFSAGFFA